MHIKKDLNLYECFRWGFSAQNLEYLLEGSSSKNDMAVEKALKFRKIWQCFTIVNFFLLVIFAFLSDYLNN
jgi:hypothetical protein